MAVRFIDPELLKLASPEELAAYEKALIRDLALSSPADFAEHLSPRHFKRPPHIELISTTIAALVNGKLLKKDGTPYRRLMINMPPRHGKSETTSKYTPAWLLAKDPKFKVGLASYQADFAAEWGAKARDLLKDAPGSDFVQLNPDSKAASHWKTQQGGEMFTAGAGGPFTGKGANGVIIDDPVKNAEDAGSETRREANWNWYLSTVITRLEPYDTEDGQTLDGFVIMPMTRWHEDDLGGRVLAAEPDEWYVLTLPAIATGPHQDVIGRLPGEALWPERYPIEALERTRSSQSAYWWSAMYQQNPQIAGGGIFSSSTFKYFTEVARGQDKYYVLHSRVEGEPMRYVLQDKCWTFVTVDLAVTTKTTSDFTVFATFAVTPAKELLLVDVLRKRVQSTEHQALLEQALTSRWQPRFVGVEKATYGLSLLQTALRLGLRARELKPDKDKVSRAYQAAVLLEQGRCYFPRSGPFLADFEHELLSFPNGAHDDQVDAFAYAARIIAQNERPPAKKVVYDQTDLQSRIWESIKKKKKADRIHPDLGTW